MNHTHQRPYELRVICQRTHQTILFKSLNIFQNLLIAVFAISVLTPCGAAMMEPLGESFFLPNNDLLAPQVGGKFIFKSVSEKCFKSAEVGLLTDMRSTFSNIDTFYNKLSVDSGVSASLKGVFTMGATVNAKTGSISAGQTQVHGTSIDVYMVSNTTYLDADCYKGSDSELIDELVAQLDNLPLNISQPASRGAWALYETFLESYGSHFIYQTNYGSLLKLWTFSSMRHNYTERELNAKSCLDFAGSAQAGKVNVSACTEITSGELINATKMSTSKTLEIRGGTDETRNALMSERSNELIAKLMLEGRSNPQAIQYRYLPIWIVIAKQFYNDKEKFAKAMNLRQFFEGFLDFGCTYIQSPEKMPLRVFQTSHFHETYLPAYECWLERNGCHSEDDCHKKFLGYCYGPSCVEYIPPSTGIKAHSARIRSEKTGSYNEGINKSCKAFGDCDIRFNYSRAIWNGEAFYDSNTERALAQMMSEVNYNEYALEAEEENGEFQTLYGRSGDVYNW